MTPPFTRSRQFRAVGVYYKPRPDGRIHLEAIPADSRKEWVILGTAIPRERLSDFIPACIASRVLSGEGERDPHHLAFFIDFNFTVSL